MAEHKAYFNSKIIIVKNDNLVTLFLYRGNSASQAVPIPMRAWGFRSGFHFWVWVHISPFFHRI